MFRKFSFLTFFQIIQQYFPRYFLFYAIFLYYVIFDMLVQYLMKKNQLCSNPTLKSILEADNSDSNKKIQGQYFKILNNSNLQVVPGEEEVIPLEEQILEKKDPPVHFNNEEQIYQVLLSFEVPCDSLSPLFQQLSLNTIPETAPQMEEEQVQNELSTNFGKNLFPNTFKKVWTMMFKTFKRSTQTYCNKYGMNFQEFQEQFTFSSFSPSSVALFFEKLNERQVQMKHHFIHLFNKILRQPYVLNILAKGKMKTTQQQYIQRKKSLIYFFNRFI